MLIPLALTALSLAVPPPTPQSEPEALIAAVRDDLIRAVRRADIGEVERLLRAAPSIARPPALAPHASRDATTALHLAIESGELAIVDVLLANDAPVDAIDGLGRTPIHVVRTPESVARLVEAGADPLSSTTDGTSALRSLLGTHPTGWPCSATKVATARALIALGVELDLDHALVLGEVDRVREAIETAPDAVLQTASLYLAISHPDIVELLLERGAPFHGGPPPSRVYNWAFPSSAITWAIHCDQFESAKVMLRMRPRAHDLPHGSHEPGWAFVRGSSPRLHEQGDLADRAIDEGDAELLELLLAAGARVDVAHRTSVTLKTNGVPRLHRAALLGHETMVDALVAHGASLDPVENSGSAALQAAFGGHAELHDHLLSLGCPTSPHALALLGRTDALLEVLSGKDVDVRGELFGMTPLAWAACGGNQESVRALLSLGADVNAESDGIPSAPGPAVRVLHDWSDAFPSWPGVEPTRFVAAPTLAARGGHFAVLDALIEAGAVPSTALVAELVRSARPEATAALSSLAARGGGECGDGSIQFGLGSILEGELALEAPANEGPERARALLALAGERAPALADEALLGAARRGEFDVPVAELLLGYVRELRPTTALHLGDLTPPPSDAELERLDFDARWSSGRSLALLDAATPLSRLIETAGTDRPRLVRGLASRIRDADTPAVEALLRAHGAEGLETLDEHEGAALRRLVGSPRRLEEALALGANPNAIVDHRNRILTEACDRRCLESARVLIDAGADPNLRSPNGRTPLGAVLRTLDSAGFANSDDEAIDLAVFLIEAGANPRVVARRGPILYEWLRWEVDDPRQRARVQRALEAHLPEYAR